MQDNELHASITAVQTIKSLNRQGGPCAEPNPRLPPNSQPNGLLHSIVKIMQALAMADPLPCHVQLCWCLP